MICFMKKRWLIKYFGFHGKAHQRAERIYLYFKWEE